MIAISKASNLWLTPIGDGDDKRFATIFRLTWRRIPAEPRRTMRQHWPASFPSIALLADWPGRGNRNVLGCVVEQGWFLTFHAPTVDCMPDNIVAILIAHELAHVVQFARLRCVTLPGDPALEAEACWLALTWGFDVRRINEWWHQNAFGAMRTAVL